MDRDWEEVVGAMHSLLLSLPRERGTRWAGREVVKISAGAMRRRLARRYIRLTPAMVGMGVKILESKGLVRVLEKRASGYGVVYVFELLGVG